MTTIWYSYLAMYIYWRILIGCALKYSPYFRSLDRTKQLKAVAYVADLTIRLPACICAGYLLAMGYMDSKLRVSLAEIGEENCLALQVFYAVAILWACECLIELDKIKWGWDMHLHHFMAVISYGYFVDGTSSLHENPVFAGAGLVIVFGKSLSEN